MNLEHAIKVLHNNGSDVIKWEDYHNRYHNPKGGFYVIVPTEMEPRYFTDRELINYASNFTDSGWKSSAKKAKKWRRHYNNRSATKRLIEGENYDGFVKGKLARDSDSRDYE